MIIDDRGEGEYVHNIFFPIPTIRAMHENLVYWKSEYMQRYDGMKRIPTKSKRYIKQMDNDIAIYEKILSDYDRQEDGGRTKRSTETESTAQKQGGKPKKGTKTRRKQK